MAGEKKRSAIARGGERRRWPCCWSMGIVLAFVGKLIRNNLPDLQHYETEKSVSLANPYLAVLHKTILAIAFLYAANNILGEQAYLKFEQPVGAFRLRLKDPDGRLTYKDFAAAPYCGKRECSEMACSCKRGQEKCKTTAGSKCKCKTKGGKTKCTVQCSSDSAADCKCSSKKGKKKCVQQRCGRSACRWLDSADITHGFMNSAFFVSTRISERPERFECIRPVAPLPDGCLADAASFPQGREQAQRCCEAGKWQQNTRDERHAKSFYVAHVEDVRLKVLASVEFPGFLRSAEETGKSCASGDGAGRPNPPCSAYYAPSTSDLVGDLKHDTGEGCMHSFPLGDDELPLATWLRSAGFGLDDASDSPGTKGGLDRYRDEGSVLIFKVAFNNVDDNEFGLLDWASGQTPPMRYSYFTERVKKSEFKHDEIRQAERVDSASAELQRLLWRRHGLFIQFQCTGRVAEFSLSHLLMALAEGLAVLEIGSLAVNWLMFNVLPDSEHYEQLTTENVGSRELGLNSNEFLAAFSLSKLSSPDSSRGARAVARWLGVEENDDDDNDGDGSGGRQTGAGSVGRGRSASPARGGAGMAAAFGLGRGSSSPAKLRFRHWIHTIRSVRPKEQMPELEGRAGRGQGGDGQGAQLQRSASEPQIEVRRSSRQRKRGRSPSLAAARRSGRR